MSVRQKTKLCTAHWKMKSVSINLKKIRLRLKSDPYKIYHWICLLFPPRSWAHSESEKLAEFSSQKTKDKSHFRSLCEMLVNSVGAFLPSLLGSFFFRFALLCIFTWGARAGFSASSSPSGTNYRRAHYHRFFIIHRVHPHEAHAKLHESRASNLFTDLQR